MISSIIATMIIEIFPSGPFDTNALLIGCASTKEAIIIDPSHNSKDKLLKKSLEHQLQVKKIYLTHSHWDHIADLAKCKNYFKSPIYVHELDAENVKNPGADGLPLFIPIEPVMPDYYFVDRESHKIGNLEFKVLHTPGHSPGSVCFYFEKENRVHPHR